MGGSGAPRDGGVSVRAMRAFGLRVLATFGLRVLGAFGLRVLSTFRLRVLGTFRLAWGRLTMPATPAHVLLSLFTSAYRP